MYRGHQPKSEVNCLRLFGGNWRFMTDINHQLNVVGSLLALAASVYPTRSLKRLSSWLQAWFQPDTFNFQEKLVELTRALFYGQIQYWLLYYFGHKGSLNLERVSIEFIDSFIDSILDWPRRNLFYVRSSMETILLMSRSTLAHFGDGLLRSID